MKEIKAFRVQEDCEGHAVIVFAKHRATAQSEGANELNCEFQEVTCRRASQYDSYAEKGYVPAAVLLADGWWWYCMAKGCFQQVSEIEGAITVGEKVFCSEECSENDFSTGNQA